tara:strand:- start:765 stop:1202 length:438 start_codon:yes stop_codon:yes gene_type:complete
MKKKEKLKLVFDFIADYLSEESSELNVKNEEVVLEQPSDDSLKRAYTIIKKLDDRDKTFNMDKTPSNNKVKEERDINLNDFKENLVKLNDLKTEKPFGVTLDSNGNLIKVSVPKPLTSMFDIKNSSVNQNEKLDSDNEQLTHNID